MAVRDEQQPGDEGRPATWVVGAGVLAAIALVALALFSGSGGYTVTATFQNASQLVPGNEVRMGGVQVGSVKGLELLDDGRAEIEMEVEPDHAPLDDGTRAVIRQTSLSGIANRFVDLQLPGGSSGGTIDDGGEVPPEDAVAAVELDALFNTLDEPTRESLQKFFEGSATLFEGNEKEAREGYRYLGPALSTGRRLFQELATDTALLDRFVVDSARFVTAAADRRDDLAGLVSNLSETTRAASADKGALAESLERLPGFMRRANTTFVNLRAALDDVDPLVSASKPAARRLRRFLPELRRFATDARPAVRDLSRTIRDPGPDDDLVELLRTFPPLTDIAVDSAQRNGATRPGAFPAAADALEQATPLIAFGRPYTPDLFGWFDDFSQTGSYDATGGFSRTQVYFNLFSATNPGAPTFVAPQDRAADFLAVAKTKQFKRCPGHGDAPAADGSNVPSAEQAAEFDCDPAGRAVGP